MRILVIIGLLNRKEREKYMASMEIKVQPDSDSKRTEERKLIKQVCHGSGSCIHMASTRRKERRVGYMGDPHASWKIHCNRSSSIEYLLIFIFCCSSQIESNLSHDRLGNWALVYRRGPSSCISHAS